MSTENEEIITRIRQKYLSGVKEKKPPVYIKLFSPFTALGEFLLRRKAVGVGVVGILVLGFVTTLYLLEDYLTKRQAFPIRQVLYQCNETVSFSGRHVGPQSRLRDRDAKTIIQKGNNDGTKLGDLIGIFKLESSDEGQQYQLEDRDKTRFAYAVSKNEPVQAGLSFTGTLDLQETYAEILGHKERYLIYSILPERGEKNIQIHVLENQSGEKRIINRLTTYRSIPLGVLWGVNYRSGTSLDEILRTGGNSEKEARIFSLVEQYQDHKDLTTSRRRALVESILETVETLESQSVYISYEDGIFDYAPQESTTYLFSRPDWRQRLTSFFPDTPDSASANVNIQNDFVIHNPDHDMIRVRVENERDFWPGNYWLLNKLELGEAPNIVRPFAHTNNGGYRIEDSRGVIAKIEIIDYFLHYGDDVLYKYYLDLDGNGKIDADSELIGQVLFRVHHDDRLAFVEGEGQSATQKDVTQRYSYSFMAGSNWEQRQRDFYLCNTIESFIVNELNRGFGKHSDLGWINNQRSNIRLLEQRSMKNLARAMSPESALVAKQDIVALFQAAKRQYINKYIQSKSQGIPE